MKQTEISFHDVRKVHPALRPYLGYCLHKLSTILKSEMSKNYSQHQMQGPHFAILSIISTSSEEINQMKLCDETGIDKASMVKIIDHLEARDLIERVGSKSDRRIKNLISTKKGDSLLKLSRKKRLVVEKKFLSALNSKEIKQFKQLLLKVLDHQS